MEPSLGEANIDVGLDADAVNNDATLDLDADGSSPLGIDARQNKVLELLEHLNARIEAVIKQHAPHATTAPSEPPIEQAVSEPSETKTAA